MLNTYALFNAPTVSFLKSSTSAINTPTTIVTIVSGTIYVALYVAEYSQAGCPSGAHIFHTAQPEIK